MSLRDKIKYYKDEFIMAGAVGLLLVGPPLGVKAYMDYKNQQLPRRIIEHVEQMERLPEQLPISDWERYCEWNEDRPLDVSISDYVVSVEEGTFEREYIFKKNCRPLMEYFSHRSLREQRRILGELYNEGMEFRDRGDEVRHVFGKSMPLVSTRAFLQFAEETNFFDGNQPIDYHEFRREFRPYFIEQVKLEEQRRESRR